VKKSLAMLLLSALMVGCTSSSLPLTEQPAYGPSAKTHPVEPAVPIVPDSLTTPSTGAPDQIRSSHLSVAMTSSKGAKAQVYLYAPNEQVIVQDTPSCLANGGDTTRTGAYAFYLWAGVIEPERQSVAPYGDELLAFNDQRPNYLQVLLGQQGDQPDLLALTQYGSCNGDSLAILALSPDGKQLVHYRFKFEDGHVQNTTGARGLEHPHPGMLRTSIFNNAIGKTTTIDWQVRESEALLVAVKTEVR
jgi:hypothetical protein